MEAMTFNKIPIQYRIAYIGMHHSKYRVILDRSVLIY